MEAIFVEGSVVGGLVGWWGTFLSKRPWPMSPQVPSELICHQDETQFISYEIGWHSQFRWFVWFVYIYSAEK